MEIEPVGVGHYVQAHRVVIENEYDRPLHALNHYYGRGFLKAFGFQDPERWAPKGRGAQAASIDQLRMGFEDGKIVRAIQTEVIRVEDQ